MKTPQKGTNHLIDDDEMDIIPISSVKFDLSAQE